MSHNKRLRYPIHPMNVELTCRSFFEAAHRNTRGDERQRRLHGHSYILDVVVSGEVESQYGWLEDYGTIKQFIAPVYKKVDHQYLNDVHGLSDTTLSQLAAWMTRELKSCLPSLVTARVSIAGDCAFRPVALPANPMAGLEPRWFFTFEAAQSLPQLPNDHPCTRLHGHSYRVEVSAQDMQRLSGGLQNVYDVLDHRCLNDIEDLEGATCEQLCEWIWRYLSDQSHELKLVSIQETESARCIYRGK